MASPTYNEESLKIYNELHSIAATLEGSTVFHFAGIGVDVEGKDGIGGLIEEWVGIWALQQGFNIKKATASQAFPDYFVGDNDALLEIKAFDYNASANFDIANFESYCSSLAHSPSRLNSDYLIFGYEIKGHKISIKDIWLKKIWEITCPSERWPLKTQTKRDVIYNIRPAAWYSTRSTYKTFNDPDAFVNALYETQEMYTGRSDRPLYLTNTGS